MRLGSITSTEPFEPDPSAAAGSGREAAPFPAEGHELFVEAVPGAGFCTTACSVDADCPASMRCGPAALRRGVPGMSPMLASGERALRCLPPDPQGP